jgi:hypothetical protein
LKNPFSLDWYRSLLPRSSRSVDRLILGGQVDRLFSTRHSGQVTTSVSGVFAANRGRVALSCNIALTSVPATAALIEFVLSEDGGATPLILVGMAFKAADYVAASGPLFVSSPWFADASRYGSDFLGRLDTTFTGGMAARLYFTELSLSSFALGLLGGE